MKRGGPDHPKTRKLAKLLDLTRYEAVGILECLFHWAAVYARRGDIGRVDDADIADGIGWEGDPAQLVTALIDSRWVDRCDCHRLRIHGWPEHADQSVRRTKDITEGGGFLACYDAEQNLAEISETVWAGDSRLPATDSRLPVTATGNGNGNKPELSRRQIVFDHWRAKMGKSRAILDGKRKRAIDARLAEGYSTDDLCSAIDGCAVSEFHMGQNKDGKIYNDIELICRDAKHVDDFVAILKAAGTPRPKPQTETMRYNALMVEGKNR